MPIATPLARLRTRRALTEWDLRDQADTIELIVSELVTNAIRAGTKGAGEPNSSSDGTLACVQLRLSSDRVFTLVEVEDENLRLPIPAQANPGDKGGRGLVIVTALSERWGWDQLSHGRGKVVWALIEHGVSR